MIDSNRAYMELNNRCKKYTYYPSDCLYQGENYGIESYLFLDSTSQHIAVIARLWGTWKFAEL